MPILGKSIVIAASPDKVFARLENPVNMLEDIPNAIDVTDITGEGVGKTFKFVYKMAGMKFSQTSTITEYTENEKIVSSFEGGITGTSTWNFEAIDSGTKLSVTIDYVIPIPLIGKIAESLLAKRNEREWDVILANAKDALEAGSD